MIAPPPMPCRMRNRTSVGRFHARPHSALAAVKISTEVEK
jgi:hypothetical protein